jgi:hypothetical protein
MGGNVFKGTQPFDHSRIKHITSQIYPVLDKLRIGAFPIGSTATPTPGKVSGDFDIIVDEFCCSSRFNETDPTKIRKHLRDAFNDAGFITKRNGISVHIKVPDGDAFYQVDITVVPNARQIKEFHIHAIPNGSRYKGLNKHLALMKLAKKQGLLWSPFQGLYRRNDNGKRDEMVTCYIEQVSYILLGYNSTLASMECLESMLEVLQENEATELMDALLRDPSWKEFA